MIKSEIFKYIIVIETALVKLKTWGAGERAKFKSLVLLLSYLTLPVPCIPDSCVEIKALPS